MDSFVGSIFSFGFNFPPDGWAQCNGQLLPIAEYQALFTLIGTTYGGDGQTTFGLPNLQGRVPIGTGTGPGLPGYVIGQNGGSENVTLLASNLPVHTHPVLSASLQVSTVNGESGDPTNNYFGVSNSSAGSVYNATGGNPMASDNGVTGSTGSGIPFSILNPFLTVNYCISLFGIFPQRN